jgi:hypothetical protein
MCAGQRETAPAMVLQGERRGKKAAHGMAHSAVCGICAVGELSSMGIGVTISAPVMLGQAKIHLHARSARCA